MHVAAVGLGQERRHVQVDLGGNVDPVVDVRRLARLQSAHGPVQHARIEREADLLDLARLRFAEDLAGAADLEIVHREVKARAELLHHLDRLEALLGLGAERVLRRREQVGVGLVVRAPDAAAQLVQLRQAELVGAIDHYRIRVRVVDAGLDDGRAQQHVGALRGEVAHHPLELALGHLAVRHRDARLGQQARKALAHALDGVDFVVQEVDLPAALQLAHHGFADQPFGKRRDEGLDR